MKNVKQIHLKFGNNVADSKDFEKQDFVEGGEISSVDFNGGQDSSHSWIQQQIDENFTSAHAGTAGYEN